MRDLKPKEREVLEAHGIDATAWWDHSQKWSIRKHGGLEWAEQALADKVDRLKNGRTVDEQRVIIKARKERPKEEK